MKFAARFLPLLVAFPFWSAHAEQASPPQGVTISVYDAGFALVNETRRVNLAKGENEIVIRQIPARLDPSTAALTLLTGGRGLELTELRYENDLAAERNLFTRYLGRSVTVSAAGQDVEGTLLAAPQRAEGPIPGSPLVLGLGDDGARAFYELGGISSVSFPRAGQSAFLEPTLLWGARAAQDGLQNVRLTYMTDGLTWWAHHEMVLLPDGANARFSARIGLRNESGGRFIDARVKLVASEKGTGTGAPTAQRYAYGPAEPGPSVRAAALSPVGSYELPLPVSIQNSQTRYLALIEVESLPVRRFYVYDGVRFDRFQRNRQNDWNYGTESDQSVETHLEFEFPATTPAAGNVPGGMMRLFQQREDDSLDYLGQDALSALSSNGAGSVKVGPARGLTGERERTGFNEIRPLHEYEETFEIRLSNFSDAPAQIRVVEHLYRGADFEVVKSDTEYVSTAPQTIEFRPDLKAGGRRVIRYTVRYRW